MVSLTCVLIFTNIAGPVSSWKIGLGEENPSKVIEHRIHRSFLNIVVLVNLPQLIVSYIYVVYNSLFTCMLLTAEWSRYAHHRKGLRVTHPRGLQRSTYYLQLPYRYAIPLLSISGLLHWLISQSITMVRINIFDFQGIKNRTISACGYSPLALVLSVSLGVLLIIVALLIGLLRRYQPGMPSAATSSTSISVVCHPPEDEVDTAILPVMFGLVEARNGIKRATFSSKVVTPMFPSSTAHATPRLHNRPSGTTTQRMSLRPRCFSKPISLEERVAGDLRIEENESMLSGGRGILRLENCPMESLMSMIGDEWSCEGDGERTGGGADRNEVSRQGLHGEKEKLVRDNDGLAGGAENGEDLQ